MQITPMLRTAALFAADILEHQPIGLCRSAAADLRYYGLNGMSRHSGRHPDLVHIGPVALTRPLHRGIGRALLDLRDAWATARHDVETRDAFLRASRAA